MTDLLLPNGAELRRQREFRMPLFDPSQPSAFARMVLPEANLTNAEPLSMVREALSKILQTLDTMAIIQWNMYSEMIMARRDRQAMLGVKVPAANLRPEEGEPEPAGPMPDEAIMAQPQSAPRPPASLPNRAARRAAKGAR